MLLSMAVACGCLAVLAPAFYFDSSAVAGLYRQPSRLWPPCDVMLFQLIRTFLKTSRGEMKDDPVVFALTDPVSLLCGLAAAATLAAAMWGRRDLDLRKWYARRFNGRDL